MRTEKKERNGAKREKWERWTDCLKESARQGFHRESRQGTKSHPQQVQEKSSTDVTDRQRPPYLYRETTADRSSSILLDRENPARQTRSPTSGCRGREIPLAIWTRENAPISLGSGWSVAEMRDAQGWTPFSRVVSTYLGSGITGWSPRGSPGERAGQDRQN